MFFLYDIVLLAYFNIAKYHTWRVEIGNFTTPAALTNKTINNIVMEKNSSQRLDRNSIPSCRDRGLHILGFSLYDLRYTKCNSMCERHAGGKTVKN